MRRSASAITASARSPVHVGEPTWSSTTSSCPRSAPSTSDPPLPRPDRSRRACRDRPRRLRARPGATPALRRAGRPHRSQAHAILPPRHGSRHVIYYVAMRMLVTGAAGFIGSNFVHHWTNEHPDDTVVAFDLLTYAGNRANLDDLTGRVEFMQGDIADEKEVTHALGEYQIDVVVNFAAESHNSLAVLEPTRFIRTNVLGTQTLLEAARVLRVQRFHHVSTCEVYGDMALDDPGAFTEEAPYRPRTPYNASKASADH